MRGQACLVAAGLVAAPMTALTAAGPLYLREQSFVSVDTLPQIVAGERGRLMDELVSTAEAVGFSGQVLVAVGGQPVLHKAYGFADGAGRRAMELNTPIGIASISKQFTAAMVLELEAQGLLSLDDSLPSFFEDVPEDKRGITLRQLVAHTSGLRSRYSEDFEPATRDQLIRGILETPASFAPGERWRYSAAGYNLLAAVVERVADRPYEEAVLRTLLEPAGMRSTGFLVASGRRP